MGCQGATRQRNSMVRRQDSEVGFKGGREACLDAAPRQLQLRDAVAIEVQLRQAGQAGAKLRHLRPAHSALVQHQHGQRQAGGQAGGGLQPVGRQV